jgi:hypothetical protein
MHITADSREEDLEPPQNFPHLSEIACPAQASHILAVHHTVAPEGYC